MSEVDLSGQTVSGDQYIAETIQIGIPFDKYCADLASKEAEIRALLVDKTVALTEKVALEKELQKIEQARGDERSSYEKHVQELQDRIGHLDQMQGQIPDRILDEAKTALANGENSKADALFKQVEEQAERPIQAAAEAAYQRGELAKDAFAYQRAVENFGSVHFDVVNAFFTPKYQ